MFFFGLLFFPFCGSTLLESGWSRLRPGEVPPRYSALLGRRGSDPLLCGFFLLPVFVLGHRDPRAYLSAGATVVSPRGSHTHGFLSPGLSLSFSCLLGLWGPHHDGSANVAQIKRREQMYRKRNQPRIPRNSPEVACVDFMYDLGGDAARFLLGIFFQRLSLLFWRLFRVLSVLGFFLGRFFAMSFEIGVRSFRGGFLGPEMPSFAPKNGGEKSSPCLSFSSWSSIFVTRWFLEGFGARTPLLVLEFLVGSGCAFL